MTSHSVLPVVLVHYRSGGMLLDVVLDLLAQEDVRLEVHVVECGDDGTVSQLAQVAPDVVVHQPGQNLGYCGGNNLVLRLLPADVDVLVINPDVRLPDTLTVARLTGALAENPDLAAVAPLIRTHLGYVEYLGSVVDLTIADAHHVRTMLPSLPDGVSPLERLPWVNGACWLLRGTARAQVGLLDERFFLFYEEVDWALRAAAAGWALGMLTGVEVTHTRSASFGTSSKGAYYYWRNRWLLCRLHAQGRPWRRAWLARWLRFVLQRGHLRSGASVNALVGGLHAVIGRSGPRPVRA